jgi:hypothetical protein
VVRGLALEASELLNVLNDGGILFVLSFADRLLKDLINELVNVLACDLWNLQSVPVDVFI